MLIAKLGVVGAGLVGGSVLLAARQRWPQLKLYACDQNVETERVLVAGGIVDECLSPSAMAERVDLVLVAVPPSVVEATFAQLTAAPLVTDAVSVKGSVQEAARRTLAPGRFIGGHPMAGGERSGYGAASGQLFLGRRVYICPPPNTEESAISKVEALWRSLGAQPERLSAEEHDRKMAWVSHGVHGIAAALAHAVGREPGLQGSTGSGFFDTTRVALGAPTLWRDILLANRASLLSALDGTAASLSALRHLIAEGDAEGLHTFLSEAVQARQQLCDPQPAPVDADEDEYDE